MYDVRRVSLIYSRQQYKMVGHFDLVKSTSSRKRN